VSFAQRQELLYDKGQASFEAGVVPDATPAELDQELLAWYAEAVRHPERLRLLKARGLITA
jgi:ATP-dependent DNA helicase RecG